MGSISLPIIVGSGQPPNPTLPTAYYNDLVKPSSTETQPTTVGFPACAYCRGLKDSHMQYMLESFCCLPQSEVITKEASFVTTLIYVVTRTVAEFRCVALCAAPFFCLDHCGLCVCVRACLCVLCKLCTVPQTPLDAAICAHPEGAHLTRSLLSAPAH